MTLIFIFFLFFSFIAVSIYLLLYSKKSHQAPLSAPSYDQFCEIRGYKISYTQQGHGPNLLLLHGIGASQFVWRFLAPRLAPFFRITAIDILGFGFSDKPGSFSYGLDSQCDVIQEFLNKMNIKESFLVGSSMGGAIALRLAEKNLKMFPAITVISPAYDPQITYFDLNRISFLSPVVRPLITEKFIKQIMKRVYVDHSLITPETIAAFSRPYVSQDAIDAFAKSFRLLRDPRTFDELSNIKSRTLILWGEMDKIISVKFAQKLHQKISRSILETHPMAGHHPHEEAPEWTFEKIRQFFLNA